MSDLSRLLKTHLWILPLLILLAELPNLRAPFTTHGEAREALVVKNMIEQSDYILPLRNGQEIPSKPPLFHWGGVVGAQLAGELSEFSIRLPSAVFGCSALIALGLAIARTHSREMSLLSMLICATAFEWFRSAQTARVDMVFASCISIALWQLYEMVHGNRSYLRFFCIAALLAGAALAKGPAGIVLPMAIIGLYLLPRLRSGSVPLELLLSLALLGIVATVFAGEWYAMAYLQAGPEFLDTQLLKENVARLAGTPGYEVGHEKPFYDAPIELLLAFLPWSILLPFVVRELWKDRRQVYREAGLRWLAVCATGVFLLICAIAVSKRPVYFLPVVPLLSYLAALQVDRRERWKKAVTWFCGAALSLLFLAGATGLSTRVRAANSSIPFAKTVFSAVPPGARLYEIGSDFYPFLFYYPGNLGRVGGCADLPDHGYGIASSSDEEKIGAGCEIVSRSENKADEGKSALLLVRRK